MRDLVEAPLGRGDPYGFEQFDGASQHEAILTAIERHDPVDSQVPMVEHVLTAGQLVTRRIQEGEPGAEPGPSRSRRRTASEHTDGRGKAGV